jgi:hypothetical protein
MNYLKISQDVENYDKWKMIFDKHRSTRMAAGLKDTSVWRNIDNPTQMIVLLEVLEVTKAKKFAVSNDFKDTMQKAGVIGSPNVIFVTDKETKP